MAELKNKQNKASVKAFLKQIDDKQKMQDCFELLDLMQGITDHKAKMWGTSMVGFGSYHYKYKSGHEGDWFITGFSPRKQNLVVYIMPGFSKYQKLMQQLGKYKTGKSCLYVKRLEDINITVLKKIVTRSVKDMNKLYACE
jgi:hypothetical protein